MFFWGCRFVPKRSGGIKTLNKVLLASGLAGALRYSMMIEHIMNLPANKVTTNRAIGQSTVK